MRKAAILLLLAALAVPSAWAADEKPAGVSGAKGGKPGTNVDMPYLMAPLTNADGKLLGYAYLSTRLTAMSEAYALAVRDKLPFIQDAMVRDVNGDAVTTPGDLEKVDVPGVERRLLIDARKVMGVSEIKLITLCTVQIALLHPTRTQAPDTPADELIPAGLAAKNPDKSRCED
jgi:hypothetical protein